MQEMTETRNDPNTGSTGWVLRVGVACEAVIEETMPLGMRNPRGDDLYAFMLTVMADGRTPYKIQTGYPVPVAATPLLYPGNTVPAKRLPEGDDRALAIDWEPALAQLSGKRTA
jgi:hypothetical protein